MKELSHARLDMYFANLANKKARKYQRKKKLVAIWKKSIPVAKVVAYTLGCVTAALIVWVTV